MIARDCLWGQPPAKVILLQDDVHVWCASLDQPVAILQGLLRTLSADEQTRAEHFYFEKDRKRFIVGRGLLRRILGYYLDIEPEQLQFSYSLRGKPSLAKTFGGDKVRFNLAHSNGLALYAVTLDRAIGVDLEYIHLIAEAEQIANRYFSDQEKAALQALTPHEKHVAFFRYWTCKEAYLKACEEGLMLPLNQVDVSLAPGEPARLLCVRGDQQETSYWSLQELSPASDYAAAIVVEGDSHRLACWQWAA